MAGAHRYLLNAPWSNALYVQFLGEMDRTASENKIVEAITDSLEHAVFHERSCDLRVCGHRFGDTMASIVAGALIAILISLGSTCGTGFAVTAGAVADPKPVAGLTSAAWGYPRERRLAHMEARSRPNDGQGAVCLKASVIWQSFRGEVEQDIVWQCIVGAMCLPILVFKHTVRDALGFGRFDQQQYWVFWAGMGFAGLGTLISIQVPLWGRFNGRRSSFLDGCILLVMEAAAFG